MQLNSVGHLAATEWVNTEKIRSRAELGEWIVMPNHIHGIIYLKPKREKLCRDASNASLPENAKKAKQRDGYNPSLHKKNDEAEFEDYKNKFGPQRGNISSIIRGFKSSCTKKIRESGSHTFAWQKGFYDHIIRNQKSLSKIEECIRENPQRWHDDRYFM